MSAVTIDDIIRDYDADKYPCDGGRIKVIPRAVAERAIKEFVIQEDRASDALNTERAEAFQYAYTFINQLLKEFEGEEVQ